jgi:hypothetical protein
VTLLQGAATSQGKAQVRVLTGDILDAVIAGKDGHQQKSQIQLAGLQAQLGFLQQQF